jgi:hypothetical protein
VDSVFNTSENHVLDICDALIARGNPLPWGCFMRPKGLTEKMVLKLKESRLAHVEFGSDSLSDSVLEAYRKGFDFLDIKESSDLMVKHGIDYCHFLIFGGPGETHATIQESFENSKQLTHGLFFPSVGMRVYPNTHMHTVGCQLDRSIPESSRELLKPVYFLSPGLTEQTLIEKISAFAQASPNWIDLEHSPEFDAVAKKLRKKGVAGPLWNYLSVLRRIS